MFKLRSLNTRMATEDDAHLPTYDHTKLSAINTCPTWGILRYSKHKKMPSSARTMPLEAGAAAHEGFAAVRWMQLYQIHPELAMYHGPLLFGPDRFPVMFNVINDTATLRTNTINFVLEALETCGFYDDVSDRNRTISNISESLIAYIDAYDFDRYPIWVRDKDDPKSDVGIEIAFDIVVTIEYEEWPYTNVIKEVRFTGKLDGLHWNKEDLIIIEEKTGGRLDDNWLAQWALSHQITGYCIATQTFTNTSCTHALVSGTRLPIGKVAAEGIRREYVPRTPLMFEKWANWFITTISTEQKYRDDVTAAPMFTHSCNRYFRTCSFLPFCAADTVQEKNDIIEEMEDDEWSPLHEVQ
jgi:hypothetical protein